MKLFETARWQKRPDEHRAEFLGELRTSQVTGLPERWGSDAETLKGSVMVTIGKWMVGEETNEVMVEHHVENHV